MWGYHEYMGDVKYIGGYHKYIGDVQYIGVFNINLKVFINFLPHMHHDVP